MFESLWVSYLGQPLNKRISEAKQRSDREREETDKRLRAITERSARAKRSLSEHSEELYRELAKKSNSGIANELIDRAKYKINQSIEDIIVFSAKIKEMFVHPFYRKQEKIDIGQIDHDFKR